jgi:hypothetical protein
VSVAIAHTHLAVEAKSALRDAELLSSLSIAGWPFSLTLPAVFPCTSKR